MSAVTFKIKIQRLVICHFTVIGTLGRQLERNLKGSDSLFNVNGWRFG